MDHSLFKNSIRTSVIFQAHGVNVRRPDIKGSFNRVGTGKLADEWEGDLFLVLPQILSARALMARSLIYAGRSLRAFISSLMSSSGYEGASVVTLSMYNAWISTCSYTRRSLKIAWHIPRSGVRSLLRFHRSSVADQWEWRGSYIEEVSNNLPIDEESHMYLHMLEGRACFQVARTSGSPPCRHQRKGLS